MTATHLLELAPLPTFPDALHFRYQCPHCTQERKMVHVFTRGDGIVKIIVCKTCGQFYELRVSEGWIKSTSAFMRRLRCT
jgi:transcription elongation factor Elf1